MLVFEVPPFAHTVCRLPMHFIHFTVYFQCNYIASSIHIRKQSLLHSTSSRLFRTLLVATLAHFYHRYYYDYVWCVRIFVAAKTHKYFSDIFHLAAFHSLITIFISISDWLCLAES